jgi:predicted nuclease of predicted toxin-antitoxin system
VKLLVDENISYRILKYIDEKFVGSQHVSTMKKGRVSDLQIWKYAKEHDFIIATYDQNFYEWQLLRDFPPYIVWLRFGNAPTKKIAKNLNAHKNKIMNMLSSENVGILEIH